ncbi:hypothetical protein [Zhongshania arctica]|uniref:Uncharacterized protein n=1 Tax=Zhongshania arctica TaxID=3238302 RepID=A0ABV3TZY2_9GAMM
MNSPILLLSAPFRSAANLDTARATAAEQTFLRDIEVLCAKLEKDLPKSITVSSSIDSKSLAELKYSSIMEDSLPSSAKPFLTLSFDTVTLEIGNNDDIRVYDCIVEFYDNTVAILKMAADVVHNRPTESKVLPKNLDELTTLLCVDFLNKNASVFEEVDRAIQLLIQAGEVTCFLAKDSFKIFEHEAIELTPVTPLWVTRIAIIDKNRVDVVSLESWIQNKVNEKNGVNFSDATAYFFIGNSLVIGVLQEDEIHSLRSALSTATYFYVLADLINTTLRNMVSKSRVSEEAQRETYYASHMRIASHIDFIESLFNDVWLGLQGHRKMVATALFFTWEYDLLKSSLAVKRELLNKDISAAIERRHIRNEKMVEISLAAIGGVAVLDFCINLFAYSRDQSFSPDEIPGFTDWPSISSIDLSLYSIAIAIGALAVAIARKER